MVLIWFIVWLICHTPTLVHPGAFLGLSDWGIALVISVILV
jgi:hypothetical protein